MKILKPLLRLIPHRDTRPQATIMWCGEHCAWHIHPVGFAVVHEVPFRHILDATETADGLGYRVTA